MLAVTKRCFFCILGPLGTWLERTLGCQRPGLGESVLHLLSLCQGNRDSGQWGRGREGKFWVPPTVGGSVFRGLCAMLFMVVGAAAPLPPRSCPRGTGAHWHQAAP